ncbi:gamma-glutamyl-gamma-aminobutyrate hydrolase family protein [Veronia nyctiphanis]|uniref:gamma-glutamyl-gamma-aminobutyrate hydrolase family protein n=1 Tax=Veronia nyctiphanis TaxID=1278244 RepID=UPI0022A80C32|nr:gamma-glutamyl-gamma-aminobutyrate hydrolase family protein [Veronia nyctiphanis]
MSVNQPPHHLAEHVAALSGMASSERRVRPLVGVTACTTMMGAHNFHFAGEKYLKAVVDGAGCLPVVIPAINEPTVLSALLSQLDGVLFTGSPSNIEPHHYNGAPSDPGTFMTRSVMR